MSYLLVLIPALFSYSNNYWNETLFVKWFLLCSGLILSVGYTHAKKIHWSVVPAYLSTALSALWYLGWRDHQYSHFVPSDIFALNKQAGYLLVTYTLGLLYFANSNLRTLAAMSKAFALFCLANSLYVICAGDIGFDCGGLLGNASMNGCLTAATYPLLIKFVSSWKEESPEDTFIQVSKALALLAPVAAILMSGRAAPLIALTIACTVYGYKAVPKKYIPHALIASLGAVCIYFGLTDKSHFLDGSGRLEVWAGLLKEFFSWPHTPGTGLTTHEYVFGIGPGLTAALAPHLQQVLNISTCCGWWMWLHNDWLQLFFEQGFVGVLCYAPLVYYVFTRAKRHVELQASVLSFGFVMLVNYPLRLATGALLCGFLVTYTFKGGRYDD